MILMLNCSYKAKDSNTQYFLELLTKELEHLPRNVGDLPPQAAGGRFLNRPYTPFSLAIFPHPCYNAGTFHKNGGN